VEQFLYFVFKKNMKKAFYLFAIAATSLLTMTACGQDKSKRPSPPAKATATTTKGTTIVIDYSQPSVKGRTIGKEIAPFGEVWRTGANEATTIDISKDVMIGGKKLAAGKYGLYTIPGEKEWTIIFNKKTDLWGSNGYKEADDALRTVSIPSKSGSFTEKMTFSVVPSGTVSLMWADLKVDFNID
jgi:predicted small lipoprotein YifL